MVKEKIGKLLICLLIISIFLSVNFVFAADEILVEDELALEKITNGVPVISYSDKGIKDSKKLAEHVSGELIIKFRENPEIKENGFFARTFLKKDKIETKFDSTNKLNKKFKIDKSKRIFKEEKFDKTYKIDLEEEDLSEAIDEYSKDSNVEYITPNYIASASFVPNDEFYGQQWAHENTDAEAGWDIEMGKSEVVIAIIDTGVDYTHEDLIGNMLGDCSSGCPDGMGYDFVDTTSPNCNDGDCSVEDDKPMDYYGHGTHVAGIAAGVSDNSLGISGVCQNCKIMPIRAGYQDSIRNGGSFTYADIAQAIVYAANNGADIVSMSFGGPNSPVMRDAIDYADDAGCILVGPAGNDGVRGVDYPAGYDNVIAVASVAQDDSRADYSNYGYEVDLSAPGGDFGKDFGIISTVPKSGGLLRDSSGYKLLEGTSMATPYVAGVAGLILSKNSSLNSSEVKEILIDSVDPINADKYTGRGRANIENTLGAKSDSKIINGELSPISGELTMVLQRDVNGNWINDSIVVDSETVDIPASGFLDLKTGKDNLESQVFVGWDNSDMIIETEGNYRVHVEFEYNFQRIESNFEFYGISSCTDGIKNQNETGIDCGGSACGVCELFGSCRVDGDCINNNCHDGICEYEREIVSDCRSLLSPETYYVLDRDIFQDEATSCIETYEDNVIIDCQGYSISTNLPSNIAGIASLGDNVIIKNCNISNFVWGWGVYIDNTNNSIISNSTFSGSWPGLGLINSRNVEVINNTLENNRNGILLVDSTNIEVINNTFRNNDDGVVGARLNNSEFINNSLSENTGGMVLQENCSNNLILNNLILNSSAAGINIFSGKGYNNRIINNTLINDIKPEYLGRQLGIHGFYGGTISGNIIRNKYGHGLFMTGSDSSNIIKDNTFCGNSFYDAKCAQNQEFTNNYCDGAVGCGGTCISCGLEVDTSVSDAKFLKISNTNYVLDSDINVTGRRMGAIKDNITLDCQGHLVTGKSDGFFVEDVNNITLKNCNLSNLYTGIELINVNKFNSINNSITNSGYGIRMSECLDTTIINNSVNYNDNGLWHSGIRKNTGSIVENNEFCYNSRYDIFYYTRNGVIASFVNNKCYDHGSMSDLSCLPCDD